jgi:hypothetical protein
MMEAKSQRFASEALRCRERACSWHSARLSSGRTSSPLEDATACGA